LRFVVASYSILDYTVLSLYSVKLICRDHLKNYFVVRESDPPFLVVPTFHCEKEAYDRYSKALQTRGYNTHDVNNVRRNVKWENKRDI